MISCSVCGASVEKDASCADCSPFTTKGWSRKATLLVAGAASVLALWLILFVISLAGKAIASDFVPLGAEYSDLTAAAAAAALLITGLGGSLTGSLGFAQLISLSYPNLIVPITLFAIIKFTQARFLSRDTGKFVSGLFFALGSAFALFFISSFATISQPLLGAEASLGFAIAIPLLVVASLSYVSIAGLVHWPALRRIHEALTPQISAIAKLQRVFWVIAVALSMYFALRMGTGLDTQIPLYAWPLLALLLLLFMPTLAFVFAPVFLGVAINDTNIWDVASLLSGETNLQWVAWLVFATAVAIALSSSVASAIRGQVDVNAWWRQTVLGAVIGLATGWLSTFTIALPSSLGATDWLNGFGLSVWQTTVLFASIGLVRGLLLHPVLSNLPGFLDGTLGELYRLTKTKVSVSKTKPVATIEKYFAAKHVVVRKLSKYTAVSALIGLFFLAGPPLAFVTSPLYDNDSTAASRFEQAIRTGETKDVEQYFPAGQFAGVVASTGYEKQIVRAAVNKEKNVVKVSWNEGKNFVELTSSKDPFKSPFLTVIPQWSGGISDAKLPIIKAKFQDKSVANVIYKQKLLRLNEIFFIPGEVKWTPDTDKQKFIKAEPVKFNSLKDATLSLKYSLSEGKDEAMRTALEKSFTEQFNCGSWKFKQFAAPKLGIYDNGAGLPAIVSSGSGTCVAPGFGTIPFSYKANARYDVSDKTWTWFFDLD